MGYRIGDIPVRIGIDSWMLCDCATYDEALRLLVNVISAPDDCETLLAEDVDE